MRNNKELIRLKQQSLSSSSGNKSRRICSKKERKEEGSTPHQPDELLHKEVEAFAAIGHKAEKALSRNNLRLLQRVDVLDELAQPEGLTTRAHARLEVLELSREFRRSSGSQRRCQENLCGVAKDLESLVHTVASR